MDLAGFGGLLKGSLLFHHHWQSWLKSRQRLYGWVQKAYQTLKYQLTSAHMLTILESTEGFFVYCDASLVDFECVLMQHGNMIASASSKLKVN